MEDLSRKILTKLKSNTLNSVYLNTLAKLPIVITGEGTFINSIEVNGDVYLIDNETNEAYLQELKLYIHDIFESDYDDEATEYLRTEVVEWVVKKCRLVNVNKFHYDDTWFTHRYSVDYPEETFGILKVENMPFKSLDKLMNKKSFICRMDQLMFNNLMQPFMLFVNRKFVNWNAIDVVFDCDDAYLLLHGDEYNNYNLEHSEIHMVILPFKAEYIGVEPDSIWNKNFDMLVECMQDTLHVNSYGKIEIYVPTMYSVYKKRGMIYNVGAWIYTQLRMESLGLLSNDRINKLKKIILNKYTYDTAGNLISTYSTKFNALDKDVYDTATYHSVCHATLDYLKSRAIFKFNDDGILNSNGSNFICNLDESLTVIQENSSDKSIFMDESNLSSTLFRSNYVVFKSGLFYPECDINFFGKNISTIDNDSKEHFEIRIFSPDKIEPIARIDDNFNHKYMVDKIKSFAKSTNRDSVLEEYINACEECINYSYVDNKLYEDNHQNAFDTVMDFDPLLFNDLTNTTIKSTTVSGKTANESLTFALGNEKRRGLKIPRYKYSDHETYVIIFLNGEVISTYSEMYVSSNYFFLPVNNNFANGDTIEFLFFTYCDNNEIHFNMTDNMFSTKLSNSSDPSFVKSDILKEYIRSEDIKIFCKYPKEIMIYKDLIEEKSDIAFNVSYRDSNNNLLLFKDVVNNHDNELIAVSSRKFIYERLYVDQKAYRIKLSERFRYCDNQKQYLLFINGRRMEDDSFLITTPKYSRPFYGIYIYITKFVSPTDRIEVFYVPEELYNINTDDTPITFESNGYIEAKKDDLSVPCNGDFYLFFVNGKKIPHKDIIPIDSHTVRVANDTRTLLRLNVNQAYRSTHPAIVSYMKGSKLSKRDTLIKRIKNTENLGYSELDALFNTFIKMSNSESDMLKWNVGRIAIINEIVRDFWVTSGFEYNERPFVYDYALDEIITKDRNGNYILPALDANPYINILKNYIRLLYFRFNKNTNIFEIGSSVSGLSFEWEFTAPIGQATITLSSQYVNGKRLDDNARNYNYPEAITENTRFYFQFNTMQATIDKTVDIKFCNGIYYGVVDEDMLQHFAKKGYVMINELMAIIPKDKRIPFSNKLAAEDGDIDVLKKDNDIITNLYLSNESFYKDSQSLIWPVSEINFDEDGKYAVCDDGTVIRNMKVSGQAGVGEYLSKSDLPDLMRTLNVVYQDSVTLDFDTYKIGSNNYFVYAAPKRLAYDENGKRIVKFIMPDLNDPDLIAYGHDDHTTPVYTDGYWDEQNCLNKLDKCEMIYLGEFEYTNPSGYTETYVIWRSNGFFTRKYDDYNFNMKIIDSKEFVDSQLADITDPDTEATSFRAVNTASPSGNDINDNIVMIDALFL